MTYDEAINEVGHPVVHVSGGERKGCTVVAAAEDVAFVRYDGDARMVTVALDELEMP